MTETKLTEFMTHEYHGKAEMDRGMVKATAEGWSVGPTFVTQARCAWGLLFGLLGFWFFRRHNVFHVTYVRD